MAFTSVSVRRGLAWSHAGGRTCTAVAGSRLAGRTDSAAPPRLNCRPVRARTVVETRSTTRRAAPLARSNETRPTPRIAGEQMVLAGEPHSRDPAVLARCRRRATGHKPGASRFQIPDADHLLVATGRRAPRRRAAVRSRTEGGASEMLCAESLRTPWPVLPSRPAPRDRRPADPDGQPPAGDRRPCPQERGVSRGLKRMRTSPAGSQRGHARTDVVHRRRAESEPLAVGGEQERDCAAGPRRTSAHADRPGARRPRRRRGPWRASGPRGRSRTPAPRNWSCRPAAGAAGLPPDGSRGRRAGRWDGPRSGRQARRASRTVVESEDNSRGRRLEHSLGHRPGRRPVGHIRMSPAASSVATRAPSEEARRRGPRSAAPTRAGAARSSPRSTAGRRLGPARKPRACGRVAALRPASRSTPRATARRRRCGQEWTRSRWPLTLGQSEEVRPYRERALEGPSVHSYATAVSSRPSGIDHTRMSPGGRPPGSRCRL